MNDRHRLERLERTISRQRLGLSALALGVVVMGFGGMQEVPVTELTLRKLVIVDETGRERLVLEGGTKEPGVATLAHIDSNGIPRLFEGTFPGGTCSLTVADSLGKARLVAGTYAGGSASLVCAGDNEAIRLVAGTRADNTAQIMLYDADRQVQWEESSTGTNTPK